MAYFNIENFLGKVADPNGFQKSHQFRCRIPVPLIGANGSLLNPLGKRLSTKYSEASHLLTEGLLCERTSAPSRQLEETTLGIYGLDEKYPVYSTYVDQECVFYTPLIERGGKQHNDVANIFHEWQNGVHRRTDTFGNDANMVMNFPDDYRLSQGMVLEQFSSYNPKRRGGILGVNINAQGNVRDIIEDVNRVNRATNWFRQIPTSWTNRQNSDADDSEGPTLSYEFFNVYPRVVESAQLEWDVATELQKVTVQFTYSYWSL